MTGILLSAGPVTTLKSVQRTSRMFLLSVTKSKFVNAAKRLVSANLGTLAQVTKKLQVFIKRPPDEMASLLQLPEIEDLCTISEYSDRFNLAPPGTIKKRLQEMLIDKGLVKAEYFKEKEDGCGWTIKTDVCNKF